MPRDKKKKKAYDKVYRKTHRSQIKAQRKAWRAANPKQRKAQTKKYREANREKLNIRKKTYWKADFENNPEKYRKRNRTRRALKQTTQVESINEKEIYLRDGWICQHCKKKVNKKLKHPDPMSPSLDHIVPLSRGGTHTYSNVQLAHLTCNISKHTSVLPQGEQMRLF